MKNSDLVRIIKDLFYKAEQAPSYGAASYCLDIAVSFFEEFSDNIESEERYEILLIWKDVVIKINNLWGRIYDWKIFNWGVG